MAKGVSGRGYLTDLHPVARAVLIEHIIDPAGEIVRVLCTVNECKIAIKGQLVPEPEGVIGSSWRKACSLHPIVRRILLEDKRSAVRRRIDVPDNQSPIF